MIRIAAIGTSMITGLFIEASRLVDAVEVTTIVSRDPERAAAFARETGVVGVATDLDAVLRSGEVDAVYVGSPNGVHGAQARAAIAAGVHVFVEKPAVPTADEFAALADEASARGVVLFEGMRNAYDPGFDVIRDLLPDVGVVRRVSFALCQRSARYDKVLAGETVNIFDPALAGGALYDLGVYPLSAMVDLFGEPEGLVAVSVPITTGADGTGTALLRYPGFIGEVAYSKISASDRPSEIQGEQGTIVIDQITHPTRVTLTRLDGTRVERVLEGPENNMDHELARFAELVTGLADGTADPATDTARTLSVLRLVDRIRAEAIAV